VSARRARALPGIENYLVSEAKKKRGKKGKEKKKRCRITHSRPGFRLGIESGIKKGGEEGKREERRGGKKGEETGGWMCRSSLNSRARACYYRQRTVRKRKKKKKKEEREEETGHALSRQLALLPCLEKKSAEMAKSK